MLGELMDIEKESNYMHLWNYLMQCKFCPDRSICPFKKKVNDDSYCVYELKLYDDFMKSLDDNYTLIIAHKMLVESVIFNMIVSQRVARRLKIDGLEQDVNIEKEDGETVSYKKEHILKQGLHLDMTRIIKMLRELKLTPKERSPKEERIIYEFKDGISKELEKVMPLLKKKTSKTM